MAILQQPGTGYRDPSKAMSIKALQSRMKAAQEAAAQATQIQNPITSPMAGLAHLAGVAAAGFGQSQAENREADARGQLAQIMSGIGPEGPTPQQTALINQLDPDLGGKIFENAMQARQQEKMQEDQQAHALTMQGGQQTFTAGESEKTRAATSTENELSRQADAARAREQEAAAAGRQDDQQAAAQELARLNAELDAERARNDAAAKTEAIGTDTAAGTTARETEWLRLNPGGDLKSPEAQSYILRDDAPPTAPTTNIYNTPGGKFDEESDKLAAQRLGTVVQEGADSKSFIANLRIVSDLGKQVGTGKGAELVQALGPYAQMVGVDIAGLDEGQAYSAITDRLAPNMRVAGAGASSDFDARQFLSSLPQLGRTPEGNQIINDTFEALGQHKMAAAEIASKAQQKLISWTEAEAQIRALPDPYDTFKKIQGGTGAPAGGGGSADIDAMIEEANR